MTDLERLIGELFFALVRKDLKGMKWVLQIMLERVEWHLKADKITHEDHLEDECDAILR